MTIRAFLLVGLLWVLSLSSHNHTHAQPAPLTGAVRVTVNAGYDDLVTWQGDDVVALQADDARAMWRVATASGQATLTDDTLMATAADAPHVEVNGTQHQLVWKNQVIWTGDMDVLGRPTISADGRWIVVSRTPLGAETASLGELWRYDTRTGEWLQLTDNGVEEVSPIISVDASRVAFLRDGDVWMVGLDRTTHETLTTEIPRPRPQAPEFDHVPPATIRVRHEAGNTCRNVPVGQIDVIPFEDYVKRVVPHETPASWHSEALKAQAVAARTYAWEDVIANAGQGWDVTDTTSSQYMCDTTDPRTNEAVDATAGQHLTWNGNIIVALFSAENASPTRQNLYGHQYLNAVDDPLAFGIRRYGHGQGYSQWGGRRLGEAGWSYQDILLHYFTNTKLEAAAGSGTTLIDTANRPTNSYVSGAGVYVSLNASNIGATQAREYYRVNGSWQVGEWQIDRDGSDGYHHFFAIPGYSDVPLDDYRIEFAQAAALVEGGELPVLYFGIDRTPPSLDATFVPEGPITPSIPFAATLSITQDDSNSGIAQTGWSSGNWIEEAERDEGAGSLISDTSASGGAAVRFDPVTSDGATHAFSRMDVSPDHYRVWVRLRTPDHNNGDEVAVIRVFDDADTPLQRGVRYVRASDFSPTSDWTWFYADVDATAEYTARSPAIAGYDAHVLTVDVEWSGDQILDIDQLVLATRPNDTDAQTITLNNPDPVMVYTSDAAGNVTWRTCTGALSRETTTSMSPVGAYQTYLPLMMGGDGGNAEPGDYHYTCE